MRKTLLLLGKYGLALGLLAWVIGRYWQPADGQPGLAEALAHQPAPGPLLLAVAVCLPCVLLTFFRWFLLVRAQELPFSFAAAVRLGFLGYFLSTFLPGATLGGDLVKAAFLARQQERRTVAVATVLLDRLIGLCGLFWLVALAGGLFWLCGGLAEQTTTESGRRTLLGLIAASWGVLLGSLLFWGLLGVLPERRAHRFAGRLRKIPRLGGNLAEFWGAIWLYRHRGRSIAQALSLTLVGHLGFVLTFFFAACTLTPAADLPSLATHYVLVPVGMVIRAGFPAPGGLGVAELVFGALYESVGVGAVAGIQGSLMQHVVEWAVALAGYFLCGRLRLSPPASDTPPANSPSMPTTVQALRSS